MEPRVCARCEVNIDHRDKRSRHCSPLCRNRDYEKAAVGRVRSCVFCMAEFMPTKNTQIFCDRTCRSRADVARNREAYNSRNAARRALERGARTVEKFDRVDVFDRDGWICQLCLSPIDWRLTGRGRYAPALDHIVPLSKGGLHVLNNVQASHSGCNARKRDREDVVLLPPPNMDEK